MVVTVKVGSFGTLPADWFSAGVVAGVCGLVLSAAWVVGESPLLPPD